MNPSCQGHFPAQWGILFAAGLWLFICWLISRLSGWISEKSALWLAEAAGPGWPKSLDF
ncbi:MAG: hypothetical protein HY922_06955 [Elusimicrobia bacterium]|nr:hypothetical protein [Elusimicrobiota bacterium]